MATLCTPSSSTPTPGVLARLLPPLPLRLQAGVLRGEGNADVGEGQRGNQSSQFLLCFKSPSFSPVLWEENPVSFFASGVTL